MQKKNEGHHDYKFIQFEIDKEMLSKNAISFARDETINPLVFKNIVKDGTAVNDFEWTKDFIEEYISKVKIEYRNNLYNFSHALLNFRKGDFDKSMDYLSKENYTKAYDKLDVRSLLIQLYYEKNNIEELLSQIDTFRHFLTNDKIIVKQRKSPYSMFLSFISELIRLRSDNKTNIIPDKLIKEINNSRPYEKNWLIEKTEEIMNKGEN